MATQQSTQIAPDGATEALFAEIASRAYLTKQQQRESDIGVDHDELMLDIEELRATVAQMGWMADIALKRLGSANCIHDGDAAAWLLPSVLFKALAHEVQS